MPIPVLAAILSMAFHSPSVTQKDFFLFRVRPCLVNHYHLWFFVKVGSGFRPKKIMRLAHAAFGGGSPNALLAPLKREVVELQLVYIVRNFYHSFFLLSDDMGVVFIYTKPIKQGLHFSSFGKVCLSIFRVTSETTALPLFGCSVCYAIFMYSADIYGSSFYKYRLISFAIYDIL